MSLLPACTTEAQLQWARPYVVSLPGSDVVYAQGRVGASCPHPQEAEVQLWDYATGTLCGVLHHPGGILRDMQWMPIKCGPTTHAAGVLAVAHDANESCAQLWVVPAVPVGKETSSTASCCHWHWEQAALTLDHCRGASALSWREPHQWECSPPKQQHELLVGCADGRVHLCEVDCSAAGQLTFEPLLSIHPNTSPVSALCWARCGCISSYFMVYYAQNTCLNIMDVEAPHQTCLSRKTKITTSATSCDASLGTSSFALCLSDLGNVQLVELLKQGTWVPSFVSPENGDGGSRNGDAVCLATDVSTGVHLLVGTTTGQLQRSPFHSGNTVSASTSQTWSPQTLLEVTCDLSSEEQPLHVDAPALGIPGSKAPIPECVAQDPTLAFLPPKAAALQSVSSSRLHTAGVFAVCTLRGLLVMGVLPP